MIEDTYEETMHFMDQINQLLGRFFIQELDNPETISKRFAAYFLIFLKD